MGMGGAVPRVRVASVAFGTTADGLGIEFYFSVERRRRLAVERSSSCQFSAITVRAFQLLLRASARPCFLSFAFICTSQIHNAEGQLFSPHSF